MRGCAIAAERRGAFSMAACVVDGRIEALEIDVASESPAQPGALFMAKVTELRPDLGAAFLDIGSENAFLSKADGVEAGGLLRVFITRAAENPKVARASTDLQLSGRYLVFTPDKARINISRKIESAETRNRLAAVLAPYAEHGGFVVRTHASDASDDALIADAEALIARVVPTGRAPGLISAAPGAVERCRAYATREMGAAQIAETDFEALDLDAQLLRLTAKEAHLSEGSMLIERTAAFVAVDVNTGSARGGDLAGRINLLAAAALPRELRLRRLGGTVLVDFAGTPQSKGERSRLERALCGAADALEGFRPLGWGPAGLYEFRCARPARTLSEILKESPDG